MMPSHSIGTLTVALVANEAGTVAHLYYSDREHDTDGYDCWCHPEFYRVCEECDEGCWKCNDDQHILSREQAAFEAGPMLAVHH